MRKGGDGSHEHQASSRELQIDMHMGRSVLPNAAREVGGYVMTSLFANHCLALTSQLPDVLLANREAPMYDMPPAEYLISRPVATDLEQYGSTQELSAWVHRHLEVLEPRRDHWQVVVDASPVCVIMATPRVLLDESAGLGTQKLDLLVSCVWLERDSHSYLMHIHISRGGIAADPHDPSGYYTLRLLPSAQDEPKQVAPAEATPTTPASGTASTPVAAPDPPSNDSPKDASEDADNMSMMVRSTDGALHYFRVGQVLYLEAEKNYTWLVGTTKSIRVRGTLTKVMERMPGFMVRVLRSFAVNALAVIEMHGSDFILADGRTIHVSDRRRTEMRTAVLRTQSEFAHLGRVAKISMPIPGVTPPETVKWPEEV